MLFDVGGVLLTNGWDHRERAAVLAHFSLDRAAYEARHEAPNDAWEKGRMSAEQFLAETVFYEPRSFTFSEFMQEMRAQSKVLESGALGTLKRLKTSTDLKLMVLNNEARELNDYRIERFGLRAYFDGFFSSCYLGLRKPDPKIYKLTMDVLSVGPGEAIFVDDRQENCDAAGSAGLRPIHYQSRTQLEEEMEALGVF